MKKFLYLFIICSIFTGCFINSHTNKALIAPYYLIASDSDNQMTISEKVDSESYVGVITPTVFEYALYNNFILAKTKNFDPEKRVYDKSISYFILDSQNGQITEFDNSVDFDNFLKKKSPLLKNIVWKKAY